MLADIFSRLGLVLTAVGAGITARAVVLSEDDAITIGVARYAGETREQNLELPAVRNLLSASRAASCGLLVIVGGTLLQIGPIAVKFFGAFSAP